MTSKAALGPVALPAAADRVEEDGEVRIFIEHNDNFRLPANPQTPVIMIGPGTGIAPFRAFMQQRAAEGAEGKNWLFFGNPHFTEDFLYQVEWQSYVKEGVLSRIDWLWSTINNKSLRSGQAARAGRTVALD